MVEPCRKQPFRQFVTAALEEPETVSYYRRGTPRAEPDKDLYAFWSCKDLGDLSRVRNLNLGGIFLETASQKELGAPVELHFLVSEGQISANAVVRHVSPGKGMGLKFATLEGQNRLRFGVLMKRLYSEDRASRLDTYSTCVSVRT